MNLFSKNKPRNRYSDSKIISARPKPKLTRKRRINSDSLLGFVSAATAVTVCVVFFVTVAVGLIFMYRWSTSSEYFGLQEIDVHGINNLSYTEVLNQAEIQTGMNNLALSLDVLEAKLLQNPWVTKVSVKRSLPDGLIINIKEREPLYWILKDGRMYYADSKGKLIAKVVSNKFLALPILEIGSDSKNLTKNLDYNISQISHVLTILPNEFHNPALYRLTEAKGLEVYFENNSLRLLFGFEDVAGNIKRMNLVLADLEKRGELTVAKEIRAHNGKVWVVMGKG